MALQWVEAVGVVAFAYGVEAVPAPIPIPNNEKAATPVPTPAWTGSGPAPTANPSGPPIPVGTPNTGPSLPTGTGLRSDGSSCSFGSADCYPANQGATSNNQPCTIGTPGCSPAAGLTSNGQSCLPGSPNCTPLNQGIDESGRSCSIGSANCSPAQGITAGGAACVIGTSGCYPTTQGNGKSGDACSLGSTDCAAGQGKTNNSGQSNNGSSNGSSNGNGTTGTPCLLGSSGCNSPTSGVTPSGTSCTLGSANCSPASQGVTTDNKPCTVGTPNCSPLVGILPSGSSCSPGSANCIALPQGINPSGQSCTLGSSPNCSPAQGISNTGGPCTIGTPNCTPSVQGTTPAGAICVLGSAGCSAGQGVITGPNGERTTCNLGTPNCAPVNQGVNSSNGATCTLGSTSCGAAPGTLAGGAGACIVGTVGCVPATGVNSNGSACTVGSSTSVCSPVQGVNGSGGSCTLGTEGCSAVGAGPGVIVPVPGTGNGNGNGNASNGNGNGANGNGNGNGGNVGDVGSVADTNSGSNGLWWKILIPFLAVAILLCCCCFFCLRRRKRRRQPVPAQEMVATPTGGEIVGGYGRHGAPAGADVEAGAAPAAAAAAGGAAAAGAKPAYGAKLGNYAPAGAAAAPVPVAGGYDTARELPVGGPAGTAASAAPVNGTSGKLVAPAVGAVPAGSYDVPTTSTAAVGAPTTSAAAPVVDAPGLGDIHKFDTLPHTRTAAELGGGPSAGDVATGLAAGAAAGAVVAGVANRKKDQEVAPAQPATETSAVGGPAPISTGYGDAPAAPTTTTSDIAPAPIDNNYDAAPVIAPIPVSSAAETSAPVTQQNAPAPTTSGYDVASAVTGVPADTGAAPVAAPIPSSTDYSSSPTANAAPVPAATYEQSETSIAPGGPTSTTYAPDLPAGADGVDQPTRELPAGGALLEQPEVPKSSDVPVGAIPAGVGAGALAGAALANRKDDRREEETSAVTAPGGPVSQTDVTDGAPYTDHHEPAVVPVPVGSRADYEPEDVDGTETDYVPAPILASTGEEPRDHSDSPIVGGPVPLSSDDSRGPASNVSAPVAPVPLPVESSEITGSHNDTNTPIVGGPVPLESGTSSDNGEGSTPEQPAKEAPAVPVGGYDTKLEGPIDDSDNDHSKTILGAGATGIVAGLLGKKVLDKKDDEEKAPKPLSRTEAVRKSEDSVAPRDSGFHPSQEDIAAGAVLIPGLGFVTYEQWLKHHNKSASPETRQEFEKQIRPLSGGEFGLPQRSTSSTTSYITEAPNDTVVPPEIQRSETEISNGPDTNTLATGNTIVNNGSTSDVPAGPLLDVPDVDAHLADSADLDVNSVPATKVAGAALVAGLGYLTFEQWRKHHNKEDTPETRREFITKRVITNDKTAFTNPDIATPNQKTHTVSGAVYQPGVGYLTFIEWLKHHKKPANEDSIKEFQGLVQPGYEQQPEYVSKYGNQIVTNNVTITGDAPPNETTTFAGVIPGSTTTTTRTVKRFVDQNGNEIHIPAAVLVPGIGYLTYEEWVKHHNKPVNDDSRREFDNAVTPDYQNDQTYLRRFLGGPTTSTTTKTIRRFVDQDGNEINIPAAVLIPGLGYLTYEEWAKHHNKPTSDDTRREFDSLVTPDYQNDQTYLQRFVNRPSTTTTTHTHKRFVDQDGNEIRIPPAVLVGGLGYLTYEEWLKHHSKPSTPESRREFDSLVTDDYESDESYLQRIINSLRKTKFVVKDRNGNVIHVPDAVLVPGVGYLTYQEWTRHFNKPEDEDSRREFNGLVTPDYQSDRDYITRFVNSRSAPVSNPLSEDDAARVIQTAYRAHKENVPVPNPGPAYSEDDAARVIQNAYRKHKDEANPTNVTAAPVTTYSEDEAARVIQNAYRQHKDANGVPTESVAHEVASTGGKETLQLPEAVLVGGVGYLTLQEWLRHHNKPDNEETRREFSSLVQPGYQHDEDFLVKHLKSIGYLPPAVLIPGVGYLTFIEWLSYTGKSETDESRREFDSLVQEGYANNTEYRNKFLVRSVDAEGKPAITVRRIVNVIKKVFVPGVGYLTYEEWVRHQNKVDGEDSRREFDELVKPTGTATETLEGDDVVGAVLVPEVGYLMYHDWLEHTHKTASPETRREFESTVQPGWEQHPAVLERYGEVEDLDDVEGATYVDGVGWLVYEDWLEHEDRMDSPINRGIFTSRITSGWESNPDFTAKYGRNHRFRRFLKDVDGAVLVDGAWYRYEDWLDHFHRTHSDETRREFESQVPAGWEEDAGFISKYGQHPKHHSLVIDDIAGATYVEGAGWLTFWDWLEYTKKPHTNESIREFQSLIKPGYETDPEYIGKYGQYVNPAVRTSTDDEQSLLDTPASTDDDEPKRGPGLFSRIVGTVVGAATTVEKAVENTVAPVFASVTGAGNKDEPETPTTASSVTSSELPTPVAKYSSSRSYLPVTRNNDPVILSGGGTRAPRHDSRVHKTGSTWEHQVPSFDNIEEEDVPDLSAYHPPAPTSHVVVTSYTPLRPDEMPMQVGDLVGIEREFADGWARGQNITHGRRRGLFPITILTPIKSGPSQTVAKVGGKHWLGWKERKTAAAEQGSIRGIPARNVSLMRRRSTRSIRSNRSSRSGGDRRSVSSLKSEDGNTTAPYNLPTIEERPVSPTPTPVPVAPVPTATGGSSTTTTVAPTPSPAAATSAAAATDKVGVVSEKTESHTNAEGSNVEVRTTVTREADGRVITKVVTITTTRHADGRVTKKTNTRTTTSNIPVPAK